MDLTKIKIYIIMNKTKRNDVLIAMLNVLYVEIKYQIKQKNAFIA